MSFRNRPVFDRRHRPRWQDELRTQQLVVAGFAVAIALALGIFGATTWNAYWEAHLRPVADVGGAQLTRSQLAAREAMITAELVARATELQAQLGGPRDTILQQQVDAITSQLNGVTGAASDSLVEGAVLATRADEFGVSVTDADVDAEIGSRGRLPERVRLGAIIVDALPDDAEAGAEPTAEQREAARLEAQAIRDRLDAGEEFAIVAEEVSDDFTAQFGGDLGWIADEDATYDEQFEAVRDAAAGDVVGPVETERGWTIVTLVERREAAEDRVLRDLLEASAAGDAAYRSYIRDELLVEAYREHFASQVVTSPAPQRRAAQIFVEADPNPPLPQERARHVLVQPIPDAQDQSIATEEQWAAALAQAEEVHALVSARDADWFAIAEERSGDPGSGANGGDLGWYDPEAPPFVEEFNAALAELEVGEISAPVRTQFGYHVVQKTGERLSEQAYAEELADELRADPSRLGSEARLASEDYETARVDGELGWVARYPLDERQEEAIFALGAVDEVSEPLDLGEDGIYIFQLLEISESREIEEERLETIRTDGFDRWLTQEVKAHVLVWVDPQFASGTDSAAQGS